MTTKRLTLINGFLCLVLGFFAALQINRPATAADPYRVFEPQLNSPAVHLVQVTPSDSVDLPFVSRGLWLGVAGDLIVIGASDGTTLNGASSANAATLTVNPVDAANLPVYSSGTPGQYIVCGDGTHAAEIISGYLNAAGTTITVTTGGGSGGTTAANAHNTGTLIAAYAPLKAANAGAFVPVRARRVMSTNTTATNITEGY